MVAKTTTSDGYSITIVSGCNAEGSYYLRHMNPRVTMNMVLFSLPLNSLNLTNTTTVNAMLLTRKK